MEREGEDVFQGLVDLLRSPRAETRNQAALALADLGDDRAVEPLIAATREYIDSGNIGTLVYALLHLDCSQHLMFLTEIVLHRTYEIRLKALMILERRNFAVMGEELATARAAFERYACDRRDDEEALWLVSKLNAVLDRLAGDPVDAD